MGVGLWDQGLGVLMDCNFWAGSVGQNNEVADGAGR